MKTWNLKYETMQGEVKTAKIRAKSASEAVSMLAKEVRIGNLIWVK